MFSVNLLEWISVGFNLAFVLLIIKENKWGWPFGILGSLLSIFLFIESKLYSEAILFSYYVVVGVFGWITWWKPKNEELPIVEWSGQNHLVSLFIGFLGMFGLGYFFSHYTDAAQPYADSFSTAFSFVATYLEAKKVLSAWIYWIILNGFSIWLYQSRGLQVYAALMILYTILSIYGYSEWRKSKQRHASV